MEEARRTMHRLQRGKEYCLEIMERKYGRQVALKKLWLLTEDKAIAQGKTFYNKWKDYKMAAIEILSLIKRLPEGTTTKDLCN